MQVLIFIFYLVIFSFFIAVIPFFRLSGIGKYTLITLFSIKVCAGIAYAKFYTLPRYYSGSDTWRFYKLSIDETKWLLHDPLAFFKDIFVYSYDKSGNLFSGKDTYWNDLKSTIVIKLLAIANVFTNNSYYANIIFFNFVFLFGLVALFKLFIQIFAEKKWLIICGVFLLPSTLFWCSGIHKDGLLLSALGMVIYYLYKGFKNKFTAAGICIISISLLLIFSLRNNVFFTLIPSLAAWSLCEIYKGRNLVIFSGIYTAITAFFFIIPVIFPSVNLFLFITNKQHEFLLLQGGSKVSLPPLLPTATSFIAFIPYAADMAFFRPHLTEIKNISYLPAIAENVIIYVLIFLSLSPGKKKGRSEPVILFLFFFSVSIMLLSGYTIPFTGAIVRYKSLVLPMLITPLLCMSNLFIHKKLPLKIP